MKKSSTIAVLLTVASFLFPFAGVASGALTLTVNEFTEDALSVTISGFFDTDVEGAIDSVFAIKGDYSANVGVNADWLDDSVGFTPNLDAFTITENTVTISVGDSVFNSVSAIPENGFGDAISFYANSPSGFVPLTAGTAVSGTLSLSRPGGFNPAAISTLELVSGYEPDPDVPFGEIDGNFVRVESVVPEPSTALLSGLGVLALLFVRRKK